mgnify:CR=1 FL=1
MDIHNLTAKDIKKVQCMAESIDPDTVFPVYPICVYSGICRSEIHIYTDWCRRKGCHDLFRDSAGCDLHLYDTCSKDSSADLPVHSVRWETACMHSMCGSVKKMKRTASDRRSVDRKTLLSEIYCTGTDFNLVLCRRIQQGKRNQPMGCIFHAPCRQL